MLASLLANHELPDTNACALCSHTTDGVVWADMVFEQPEEKHDAEELGGCLVGFVFGVARFFSRAQPVRDKRYVGYRVMFRVPVRCCETCAITLTEKKLRSAVRRQRVCAQILDKYTQLLVWRAK